MPGQLFSGTLGLLRPSSAATKEKQDAERREREGDRVDDNPSKTERPKIVWFKPTDKRVPLIAIPTEQAPADFVHNSEAYADRLFVACIKRHVSPLFPLYVILNRFPSSSLSALSIPSVLLLKNWDLSGTSRLKPALCSKIATSQRKISRRTFSKESLLFLGRKSPSIQDFPFLISTSCCSIPEREYEVRRDFRSHRVFTIDPSTAKDLDDALSLEVNEDGTYNVGVHIADVSYFVRPNTHLDRDARKRATSVYLVQRAVPMLPPSLSEELCSLLPGRERLAFSTVFTMTKDGRVLNKWFGRTIIKYV